MKQWFCKWMISVFAFCAMTVPTMAGEWGGMIPDLSVSYTAYLIDATVTPYATTEAAVQEGTLDGAIINGAIATAPVMEFMAMGTFMVQGTATLVAGRSYYMILLDPTYTTGTTDYSVYLFNAQSASDSLNFTASNFDTLTPQNTPKAITVTASSTPPVDPEPAETPKKIGEGLAYYYAFGVGDATGQDPVISQSFNPTTSTFTNNATAYNMPFAKNSGTGIGNAGSYKKADFGNAFSGGGNGTRVYAKNATWLNPSATNGWTIATWALRGTSGEHKPSVLIVNGTLVSVPDNGNAVTNMGVFTNAITDASTNIGWGLYFCSTTLKNQGTGRPVFRFTSTTNGTTFKFGYIISSATFVDGVNAVANWNHFAVTLTRGSENDTLTLYMNGAAVGSTTLDKGSYFVPPANGFYLNSKDAGQGTQCANDDLAMWNRALAEKEIAYIAGEGSPTTAQPLSTTALHEMAVESEPTITDVTGTISSATTTWLTIPWTTNGVTVTDIDWATALDVNVTLQNSNPAAATVTLDSSIALKSLKINSVIDVSLTADAANTFVTEATDLSQAGVVAFPVGSQLGTVTFGTGTTLKVSGVVFTGLSVTLLPATTIADLTKIQVEGMPTNWTVAQSGSDIVATKNVGSGTAEDPFLVDSIDVWNSKMIAANNAKVFKLTANIELTAVPAFNFGGTLTAELDASGKPQYTITIPNTITNSVDVDTGLFRQLTNNGLIENIRVVNNASLTTTGSGKGAGGLIGRSADGAKTTIRNVDLVVGGFIKTTDGDSGAGGVIGYVKISNNANTYSISNCTVTVTGTIQSTGTGNNACAGGLVGRSFGPNKPTVKSVENNTVILTSTATVSGGSAGGLAGQVWNAAGHFVKNTVMFQAGATLNGTTNKGLVVAFRGGGNSAVVSDTLIIAPESLATTIGAAFRGGDAANNTSPYTTYTYTDRVEVVATGDIVLLTKNTTCSEGTDIAMPTLTAADASGWTFGTSEAPGAIHVTTLGTEGLITVTATPAGGYGAAGSFTTTFVVNTTPETPVGLVDVTGTITSDDTWSTITWQTNGVAVTDIDWANATNVNVTLQNNNPAAGTVTLDSSIALKSLKINSVIDVSLTADAANTFVTEATDLSQAGVVSFPVGSQLGTVTFDTGTMLKVSGVAFTGLSVTLLPATTIADLTKLEALNMPPKWSIAQSGSDIIAEKNVGTGTAEDPFLIDSVETWNATMIAANKAKVFKLAADVTLTNIPAIEGFTGTLTADLLDNEPQYTITLAAQPASGAGGNTGLFSTLGAGSLIENICVSNTTAWTVNGMGSDTGIGLIAGCVANDVSATVRSVLVVVGQPLTGQQTETGTSVGSLCVGGVVGLAKAASTAYLSISNCTAIIGANITAKGRSVPCAGGLMGRVFGPSKPNVVNGQNNTVILKDDVTISASTTITTNGPKPSSAGFIGQVWNFGANFSKNTLIVGKNVTLASQGQEAKHAWLVGWKGDGPSTFVDTVLIMPKTEADTPAFDGNDTGLANGLNPYTTFVYPELINVTTPSTVTLLTKSLTHSAGDTDTPFPTVSFTDAEGWEFGEQTSDGTFSITKIGEQRLAAAAVTVLPPAGYGTHPGFFPITLTSIQAEVIDPDVTTDDVTFIVDAFVNALDQTPDLPLEITVVGAGDGESQDPAIVADAARLLGVTPVFAPGTGDDAGKTVATVDYGFKVAAFEKTTEGAMDLTIEVRNGIPLADATFVLQYSEDLVNWTDVDTGTRPSFTPADGKVTGDITLTLPESGNRAYRVIVR